MKQFVKIAGVIAAIAVSAAALSLPTRPSASDGQVLSVIATEVPAVPTSGGISLR